MWSFGLVSTPSPTSMDWRLLQSAFVGNATQVASGQKTGLNFDPARLHLLGPDGRAMA